MDYNILLSHGIDPQECSHLDYIDNDKEILIFAKLNNLKENASIAILKILKLKIISKRLSNHYILVLILLLLL